MTELSRNILIIYTKVSIKRIDGLFCPSADPKVFMTSPTAPSYRGIQLVRITYLLPLYFVIAGLLPLYFVIAGLGTDQLTTNQTS